MMITKQYKLINNIGGWLVFLVALLTYWLTLEPTASYWDCGEFIIQADKLEVGHPPGNPIFMLTARFFANFAPSVEKVSVMVNAMSGLLSALTILLLFWTITHLVRRLVVKDGTRSELSLRQYLVIMGSGVVGSLAYCWSDTFWFSAVEGEVYAFSSFCTALVFWLILKWENRADEPHSDRYLILIAYIIGVSVAVHLLNLLCIPAIVLVFVYKKWPGLNLVGSLVALLVSFGIIFFVLYGLVPGFIKVAQVSELLFVNGFHLGFNSGAIAYLIIMTASLLWALSELYTQRSETMIIISFMVAVTLSGVLFIGAGVTIGIVLSIGLLAFLLYIVRKKGLPVRVLNVVMWSIGVIFIGYSSYALIIIRSTADTPMNQNAPDNVFALASYLNREQYGENPLLYGETLYSGTQRLTTTGAARVEKGAPIYTKGVAGAKPGNANGFLTLSDVKANNENEQRGGDYYVKQDYKPEYVMNPELNMLFPRLYSRQHADSYQKWVTLDTVSPSQIVPLTMYDPDTKTNVYPEIYGYQPISAFKPSFSQNLAYFFNYQLNHMYMRYFLWNFVGRQNDVLNQNGEYDAGNWISGIPSLDNWRLGDQSLLPESLGEENPGHNVYFFLPLLLGIIGLIWQSFAGRRGIEQFWVIFFLFFMTGIAIVLYLNQTPDQPRERDYAFAGSFYAFAIWIGMGVAGVWRYLMLAYAWKTRKKEEKAEDKAFGKMDARQYEEPEQSPAMTEEPASLKKVSLIGAAIAVVVGLFVPIQMVSQTWDDHDRSGRYAARDFAINYLESLEPNAIVFCNGDNDTFPLWYVQEVEGVRPDVRIINLSYLNSDWYANQHRMQSYDAAPTPMTAKPEDIAYGNNDIVVIPPGNSVEADLMQSLRSLYAADGVDPSFGYKILDSSVVSIPIDKKLMVKRGLVAPQDTADIVDKIVIDLKGTTAGFRGYLTLGEVLMLDIIATNAAEGWPRPIYWASTVGDSYHLGLTPYVRSTGMTYQLVPTMQADKAPRTDRAYNVVMNKYQWGTRPCGKASPYFDETARRMLFGVRNSMIMIAQMLYDEGCALQEEGNEAGARDAFRKAMDVVTKLEQKMPETVNYYDLTNALDLGKLYGDLGEKMKNSKATARGKELLEKLLVKYAAPMRYRYEIYDRFNSENLTHEMRYLPYYYYDIAQAYLKLGGERRFVDKQLEGTGWSYDVLAQYYDYASGGDSSYGTTLEEFAADILSSCEEIVALQQLSPAEYAKCEPDLLLLDSLMEYYIQYYIESGGSEAELQNHEAYRQLDRGRTRRLFEEYQRKNGR